MEIIQKQMGVSGYVGGQVWGCVSEEDAWVC